MIFFLALLSLSWGACLSQFRVTAATPECRWMCDDPICPAECEPVCDTPECIIQCTSGTCFQALPVCSTRCATEVVVSDNCPVCETICEPLPALCTPHCGILCEAVSCTWSCRKPSNCVRPQCELACERPACESPTPCSSGSVLTWSLALSVILFFL